MSYDAKTVVESNFKTKRRIVLKNAVKFVEAFKWRFDNEAIAPISTNEIGLQVAMGCENNKNPRKIINSYIGNLLALKVIKLESDAYSYDRSISKLYSFNQLVYARLLDYASSRYQISLSQFNDSLSYHISYLYGDCGYSMPVLDYDSHLISYFQIRFPLVNSMILCHII